MPAYTTTEQPRPAPAPPSERVQRYEANLDKALELTPASERLAELREERVRWIARYEQFVDDVDRDRATPVGATVHDYLDVIDLLAQRIAAEERKAAVIPTEANHAS